MRTWLKPTLSKSASSCLLSPSLPIGLAWELKTADLSASGMCGHHGKKACSGTDYQGHHVLIAPSRRIQCSARKRYLKSRHDSGLAEQSWPLRFRAQS